MKEPARIATGGESTVTTGSPPRTVGCWVSNAKEITECGTALRKATEQFSEATQELVGIGEAAEIAAFSSQAVTCLRSIEAERIGIIEQSESLKAMFRAQCRDQDGSACTLSRLLEQVRVSSPETVQKLCAFAETLGKNAILAEGKVDLARREIVQLRSESAELARLLSVADPSLEMPPEGSAACHVLGSLSMHKKSVAGLRMEMSVVVAQRRDAIVAEIDQLAKRYDFDASPFPVHSGSYSKLKEQAVGADDFGDVLDCEKILEDLEARCRTTENSDSRRLAGRLQKEPEKFCVFLELCDALLKDGSPELAHLILYARQHAHEFEEISEDPDQALGILLESVCADWRGQGAGGQQPAVSDVLRISVAPQHRTQRP